MLVWGSGGNSKEIGPAETKCCTSCDKTTNFHYFVQYHYFHIWYLFSFLTSTEYFESCPNCGASFPVEKKQVKEKYEKIPIPLIRKNGWFIVLAILACFAIYIMNISSSVQAEEKKRIEAPLIHDVYYADLSSIPNSGYNDEAKAYGLMKLISSNGNGNYTFVISSMAYDKKKGVRKNESNFTYDMETPVTLSQEQIADFYNKNYIYQVNR